ncbi:MAG TPA: hypothetical protein VI451_00215, partial [Anaerolineales bacterium]|nr:hypothetical protein [Anaerolineales bacterium]
RRGGGWDGASRGVGVLGSEGMDAEVQADAMKATRRNGNAQISERIMARDYNIGKKGKKNGIGGSKSRGTSDS